MFPWELLALMANNPRTHLIDCQAISESLLVLSGTSVCSSRLTRETLQDGYRERDY
ncbi:hypothetical protein MTOK_31230 [Mycolicibacterium tokaiense]|nr:hypothetical protein MTOK_31230 [Mycolicibacterium tokaiense]